jgi:ABC-type transport system involved in multi-copper enzyme maturation permease subunit
MIYRFYKNLLTDEGYLMFTLPTKTHQLITSKYLATLIWMSVSVLIIIGSAALAFGTPENIQLIMDSWKEFLLHFESSTGSNTAIIVIALCLFCLMAFTTYVLLIYASIAVGQLFTKNRLVGAFVSYIGIATIMQMLLLLLLVITNVFPNMIANDSDMIPLRLLFGIIVYQLIVSIVFFIITNKIFQKKLNLE